MAYSILNHTDIPRNIEHLDDGELLALCDEPEFMAECTPLELELIVRLGAALEVSKASEGELLAEVRRLSEYEPASVRKARQKAATAAFDAMIAEVERRGPRAKVMISA